MTVEEREKRTLLAIANKIEMQADVLVSEAETQGPKSTESLAHLHGRHFKKFADEIREVLGVGA